MTKVSQDESLVQGHTVDQLQMWEPNVHIFFPLVSFPFHHIGKCPEKARREGVCVYVCMRMGKRRNNKSRKEERFELKFRLPCSV